MRFSRAFIPTLKETPADAQVVSHVYLVRGGYLRQLAAGIYNLLPLGWRVIKKIEDIVRDEMNRAGAEEVLMPASVPAELWQESGRWQVYGPELLRWKDRKGAEFCTGPTHEEVIVDMVRRDTSSYRDLPLNLYQIQSKFRDEKRPRAGLMRGREFIMKDAYSFDRDEAGALRAYDAMYAAYGRIFKRCGLDFRTDPLSRFPLLTIPDSPFPNPGLSACAIAPGTGNVGDCVVTTRGDHDAFLARQTARQDS